MTPEQLFRRQHSEKPLEERLADVCRGCGQHSVTDDVCALCGTRKSAEGTFVGETRIE